MFCAIKQSYKLEVRLYGERVSVKLLTNAQGRGIVARTLARCEEFLAQVSLQEQKAKASLVQLMAHFQKRGWQVVV